MHSIAIRPARPDDAEAIEDYHHRCFLATYPAQIAAGEISPPDRGGTKEQLRGWFQPGSLFTTHVAVVDDVAIGHFTIYEHQLVHLFVAPQHQGTGLGGRLLAAGEAMIAEAGHTELELHARVENLSAIAFYEAAGWTVTDRLFHTVEHGISYDENVLVKYLRSGDSCTWEFIEDERSDDAIRYSVAKDGNTANWSDIVDALQLDPTFRGALSDLITASRFEQVFWETTPLNLERSGEPFRFAVVRARLNRRQNSRAFSEFFDSEHTVATFPNLGRSAVLVAPAPLEDGADRSYLKSFLTTAPAEQIHELWRSVGAAITDRLSDDPVWVSTSGGGVPWLHVRLDNSPKYYAYAPFRAWPPTAP